LINKDSIYFSDHCVICEIKTGSGKCKYSEVVAGLDWQDKKRGNKHSEFPGRPFENQILLTCTNFIGPLRNSDLLFTIKKGLYPTFTQPNTA
jgi:hypothetical protein